MKISTYKLAFPFLFARGIEAFGVHSYPSIQKVGKDLLLGAALCISFQISCPQISSADVDISAAANLETISTTAGRGTFQNGLREPTPETPQIVPPSLSGMQPSGADAKKPIVEGLIYMEEKYDRPDFTDVIVITVRSMNEPSEILAGAKYPVSKARLPFNFKFYEANILKGKADSFRVLKDKDYIVEAVVCGENSKSFPCSEDESVFSAKSISKLLPIPGIQEGDIRTPASLPLKRIER